MKCFSVHTTENSKEENEEESGLEFDQLYGDYSEAEVVRHLGQVEVGSLVEAQVQGSSLYGVVRWTGTMAATATASARLACNVPDSLSTSSMVAGIEMEDEVPGGFSGGRLFECPPSKGILLPFTHFRADRRFYGGGASDGDVNSNNNNGEDGEYFGSVECPSVTGFHPPIRTDDIFMLWGRNK